MDTKLKKQKPCLWLWIAVCAGASATNIFLWEEDECDEKQAVRTKQAKHPLMRGADLWPPQT